MSSWYLINGSEDAHTLRVCACAHLPLFRHKADFHGQAGACARAAPINAHTHVSMQAGTHARTRERTCLNPPHAMNVYCPLNLLEQYLLACQCILLKLYMKAWRAIKGASARRQVRGAGALCCQSSFYMSRHLTDEDDELYGIHGAFYQMGSVWILRLIIFERHKSGDRERNWQQSACFKPDCMPVYGQSIRHHRWLHEQLRRL